MVITLIYLLIDSSFQIQAYPKIEVHLHYKAFVSNGLNRLEMGYSSLTANTELLLYVSQVETLSEQLSEHP